jgi:hypothetical protein
LANLSIVLPQIGVADATQDPVIVNAFTTIQSWSAQIDASNFGPPLNSAWAAYTPTWTAGGGPTVGNGSLVGAWLQIGKLTMVRIYLALGSTSTLGTGPWGFALPFASRSDGTYQVLNGTAISASTATPVSGLVFPGGSVVAPFATNAVDIVHPITWTSGNILVVQGSYEAA